MSRGVEGVCSRSPEIVGHSDGLAENEQTDKWRLNAGSCPVHLRCSEVVDNIFSDSESYNSKTRKLKCKSAICELPVETISDRIRETMRQLTGFDHIRQEVDRMSDESQSNIVAVFSSRDEKIALRRRKKELEEDLRMTRDKLLLTSEDVVNIRGKLEMVQEENRELRKQLSHMNNCQHGQFGLFQFRQKGGETKKKDEREEKPVQGKTAGEDAKQDDKKKNEEPKKGFMAKLCESMASCFKSIIFCGKKDKDKDQQKQKQ